MPNSATTSCILPRGEVLQQEDVQQLLGDHLKADASLDATLNELNEWLESIGYFAHLTEPNEYLSFEAERMQSGIPTRLQINYARLAYKAPEGPGKLSCPLCIENIGTPGKELLRVVEFSLNGTPYFAHPTPFPLHPGHFVVNSRVHEPMRIGEPGFREAADFATRAPGWLVASNSDIAWAGASVLSHHHIQVFKQLNLPIEQAKVQTTTQVEKAMVSLLNWYTPVLRIIGPSESVLQTTSSITTKWKSIVKGKTTCNYLMRSAGADQLCIHLLLRHSDYRTPKSLQHIKAEGVGIIEMAGEIIVPPISGKDRNENKAWFQKHGPMVVEGIIDGNAPKAGDFMPPDFLQLVL